MIPEPVADKGALFEGKRIRKVMNAGEQRFSIIDVIEALTESERPRKYWSDLKKRLFREGYVELSDNIGQLKMFPPDGKMRFTDCANTDTLFRIIQSVRSSKVELLKRWLAGSGKGSIDEIEDPESSMERIKAIYAKKGYPWEWIDKCTRGIAVHQDLTDKRLDHCQNEIQIF
jgi:DNA-damage-inducible protein D